MSDYINAWECIGCGRLEASAACVGICQDRKVELVHASRYEELQAEASRLRERMTALEAVVRQIAVVTPRTGECERSWQAIQQRARQALKMTTNTPTAAPAEAADVSVRIR